MHGPAQQQGSTSRIRRADSSSTRISLRWFGSSTSVRESISRITPGDSDTMQPGSFTANPLAIPANLGRGCDLEDCQDALAGDPFMVDLPSPTVPPRATLPPSGRICWCAHSWPTAETTTSCGTLVWPTCRNSGTWRSTEPKDTDALPYYLEDRYRRGAFATFLGLTVDLGEQSNPGTTRN